MRQLPDWINAYVSYASVTEAPKKMHFWSAVSCIAGALRRKVWIDMVRFQWMPSMYIIFVAPPGVVSKSTTADISMDLLRAIPGINFGPDVVTWPALVSAFAASNESFQFGEDWYPMSAITLVASELGNLINPQDRDMINLYINLWDGRKSLEKVTKTSGCDTIEAPWINMIGCTTPHWIADNMPAATVGGGFTSRCIFIYADTKEKYVAYVDESVDRSKDATLRAALLHDLEDIATTLVGPFTISKAARDWGTTWYEDFWKRVVPGMTEQLMEGYAARKQTHMHKTAMILSASRGGSQIIEAEDLQLAEIMLTNLEPDMMKVFSKIGRSEDSQQTDRFIEFVHQRGFVAYQETYRMIHSHFPDFRDFEGVVSGAIRAGYITLEQKSDDFWFRAAMKPDIMTKPSFANLAA
jgi:hypothetical protein